MSTKNQTSTQVDQHTTEHVTPPKKEATVSEKVVPQKNLNGDKELEARFGSITESEHKTCHQKHIRTKLKFATSQN